MALSAFDDRNAPPSGQALDEVLGRASLAWASLERGLLRACAPLEKEWAFAGAKFGWSLRLKRGKRVIVYMTPCAGHFLASFALGEKACAAAREAKIPARILARIDEAPKYAEGRGVRIPVRTERDASAVRKLAEIKLAG
ncbi:MAG: DUF3788 family protein [Candidatus Latescibacterota bacterium]|nr:MAG: DUF3788 family protein [Candidatus Latescibacterota bacterium]